jgi:hypothetical protein
MDSSPEGGPSCNAKMSGGLVLNQGYQTTIGKGGYCYAFADGNPNCGPCGTSTACSSTSTLCAVGNSAAIGGYNYGAGFGCSLNQAQITGDAGDAVAAINTLDVTADGGVNYVGINYSLSLPGGAIAVDVVNLMIDNSGTEYYCPIAEGMGTCLWSMFSTAGYGGTPLTGAPTAASHIQVQVNSGVTSESWQSCISSLAFAPPGGVGDPCFAPSDCQSGTCTGRGGEIGWCTTDCQLTSDCYGSHSNDNNAQGTANVCVQPSCVPGCTQGSDCAVFGGDCESTFCVAGVVAGGGGGIGDPCVNDDNCASFYVCTQNGGPIGWCTTSCTSASDCYGAYSGNTNAVGTTNDCDAFDGGFGSICVPECPPEDGCSFFTDATCQAGVCSVTAGTGGIGDPCLSTAGCASGTFCTQDGTGAMGWCTTTCTSLTDCTGSHSGTNSEGTTNFCVLGGDAAASYCNPSCMPPFDCSAFSDAGCDLVEGDSGPSACCFGASCP